MHIAEIKKKVSHAVTHQCMLPDAVRELIRNDLEKSQKDKFVEIVISEVTKTIKDEISAEYDIWRDW